MTKISFQDSLVSIWEQTIVDNAKTVELEG